MDEHVELSVAEMLLRREHGECAIVDRTFDVSQSYSLWMHVVLDIFRSSSSLFLVLEWTRMRTSS
jgi:hypothetical protein